MNLITPLHHSNAQQRSFPNYALLEGNRKGQGGAIMIASLPEDSERDSEPDDAGFLQLLAGKVKTAVGSTQSVAEATCGTAGETHCALLGLTEIWANGDTQVCAAADTLPVTFSSCLLAEKPLHMQSWMMMELRLPNSSSVSGMN